ncbi:MAG: DNA polymerase III subunit alpha [Bacilli bacterium]|nr:DNA polymerase III subunit alpha [Bacilli bacterium]
MYTPLYIKTENTLLSSMIKINELINYAVENNLSTLTITDNNMFGAMEFYLKCIKNNIKPIIGLEIKVDNKIIILYAKNNKGYKNLIKISSNDINFENIKSYSDNLICIIPFNSTDLYNKLKDMFEHTFISYKNDFELNQIDQNIAIYMNEILSLNKEDAKYINYLYAIKEGLILEQIDINKQDNYIKSLEEYIKIDKTIKNNYKINELCNITITKENDLLPIYDCPNNDQYSYLKKLCIDGMKQRFGNEISKTYQERLRYELDVINKMGFCNYFLIVQDYVNYAKSNGILVGPGRGSAAGSLVSYILNITDVDPIKYNLLFERFLNPERITMPDIDIDFEYNRREEVINYCINKYGLKKVAGIITFGTLGAKQSIRDVGRVQNVDLSIIDRICKNIDTNLTLKENYNKSNNLKQILNDKSLMELYKVAIILEGMKRHISSHAAGIVMCNKEIDEVIPLYKKDNFYITGYSMEYLEDIGLLKMDFLALKNLTTITNIVNDINSSGINIDFNNIPLDDEKTLDLFKNGDTLGIFQFESSGMIKFLKKFKPDNFEDLFACLALYRPGPMDNIDLYIERKNGQNKIDYIIEELKPILKPTYGIMIYQEQIMQVAHVLANYSLGEADILRRAISKKKESVLLKEKEKFIKRAINNGYNINDVEKVFNLILKFASYGFNRAHSVAYSFISYKMAYLKVNYPKYFMRSLLDMATGSVIDTKDYINECKNINLNVLCPDINKSGINYIIENDDIRYPLSNIKNIGNITANYIINERKNGFYLDIYDFIKRSDKKIINKKILESLILSGCFSESNINKKTLINNLDLIINYGELIKDIDESYALKPILEDQEEFSLKELLDIELDLFGFYLTNHPVTIYKNKYKNIIDLKNVSHYFDKTIDIIVLVDKIKEIETKKNDIMCFIVGSDEQNNIDIVLFPKIYDKLNKTKHGDIVLIRGKVEKRFDKYQIIVDNLKVLD